MALGRACFLDFPAWLRRDVTGVSLVEDVGPYLYSKLREVAHALNPRNKHNILRIVLRFFYEHSFAIGNIKLADGSENDSLEASFAAMRDLAGDGNGTAAGLFGGSGSGSGSGDVIGSLNLDAIAGVGTTVGSDITGEQEL